MKKWFAIFAASIVAVVACGARTGLPVNELHSDAGVPLEDAGPDVEDAPDAEDAEDAPPDVVVINDCQDAGITYIYVISTENTLLRFYPPDLSFTAIGTINCPGTSGSPFSMAVDRAGVAYVVFNPDGELFRVSTLTASCKDTGFVAGQAGFPLTFGMGFSSNKNDPGETLFVAGDDFTTDAGSPLEPLATIDPTSFDLSVVGKFSQPIGNVELTGTGDARLFGFGPGLPSSHLAEIDKASAAILSDTLLDLNQGAFVAWAFAFWGGEFYFFTSESGGSSVVHRYTPGGTTKPPVVKQIDGVTIVGAGVSTCAPSE